MPLKTTNKQKQQTSDKRNEYILYISYLIYIMCYTFYIHNQSI